jgi:uncharacterized integral membrane protein
MRTVFRLFVVVPIALLILVFAVANRHWVTVSFDPFPGDDIAGPSITAPLYIMLVLAGIVGMLAGGCVVWMRQGKYRRQAREARAEAAEARGQANDLRDRIAAMSPTPAAPLNLPKPGSSSSANVGSAGIAAPGQRSAA